MRYLILSDIHANLTALNAALDASQGQWDRVVCLGDIVGYGPDPNQAVERVRALNAFGIRGNHDKAVSGISAAEDFNPMALQVVLWTRVQLRQDNLEYVGALAQGPLSVDDFSIAHGAAHDEDEYIFAPEQAAFLLESQPSPVSFFGHTHIQGGFAKRDGQVDIVHSRPAASKTTFSLPIDPGSTYMLNPGSIGQPRDADPRAAFAIADLNRNSVEFWRVPYDIEAVQKRMMRFGLPESLIIRLSLGR